MACACAAGTWTTGTVNTNHVETEKVNNFLGMSTKFSDNDTQGFYPNPKVTDNGVRENAMWASLAATAVAALETAAAIKIANKQYDIANAYYKIAQKAWDRFKNKYMPCEKVEMKEACGTPEYVKRYDTNSSNWIAEVNRDFAQGRRRIDSLYATYCICSDKSLAQDIAMMQGITATDAGNFAFRYEEHRKDAKDDIRWTRRQQALNRGRDLQSTAAKYAEAAANAYGDIGAKVGQVASEAMQAIGYFSQRRDTITPQRPPQQRPSNQLTGGGFIGAEPQNGQYGFIAPKSSPVGNNYEVYGYDNTWTPYSSNNSVTSMIGAQQPSSPGG